MAIFGSLKQISLGDLLPLLKTQRGSLEIFNLEDMPHVTLYVEGGRLVALYMGGKPVDDVQVRSIVGSLMNAKRGSFEFIPGVSPRARHAQGWNLDRLLLAVSTIADEMAVSENNLPHPDTVFKAVHDVRPGDGRMTDFWRRAKRFLLEGVSVRDLSLELGVPVNHAAFYLHKLRGAGAVEPVRVAGFGRPARSGVASRLLGALRRRFFGGLSY